jgi:hypothetical protein
LFAAVALGVACDWSFEFPTSGIVASVFPEPIVAHARSDIVLRRAVVTVGILET